MLLSVTLAREGQERQRTVPWVETRASRKEAQPTKPTPFQAALDACSPSPYSPVL